ncbi:MAG: hypothetical protein PHX45_03425 [Acidobacteriota bacterium]|nr:hypothetical protein [Acidobacteriota bacterium]
MARETWKEDLRKHFENIKVIEKCKAETISHFDQFCEFIAEPAFESLGDELKIYGIRTKYHKAKEHFIHLQVCFPGSKADNFHYRIVLPKNSIELKLKLVTKGRRSKKSSLDEKLEDFMCHVTPADVLKLSKEDLIRDILEHYKDYNYEALTSSS